MDAVDVVAKILTDRAPTPAGHYSQATIAGRTPQQLARVTAYIVGVANWPRFNAIYAALLPEVRPARTVVPVPELHYGFLVEIDAIAILAGGKQPEAAEG